MNEELEKLVVIESPFKGKDYSETQINLLYAKECVIDSLLKGEFPFASHLFYTQDGILNDKLENERELGIKAGIAWGEKASKRIVYSDRGISEGMKYGIEAAKKISQKIIYRNLPDYEKFLEKIKKMNLQEGYEFKANN